MRRRWKWLLGAVVVVVVLGVAGPFVYIHFIEGPAPAKLTLPKAHGHAGGSVGGAGSALDGTYHVGAGSEAGYRVAEVLVGQHATAVGRTKKIWGSITVAGGAVTTGTVSVDMASVVSDQSQRNAQFDGRIMDVARYPTSTLQLTAPITIGAAVPVDVTQTYQASGTLLLHGVRRPVHFSVTTERTATTLYALVDLPITFAQWGISNPSVGGFVTTADSGTLEVLLHLTKGTGNAPSSGSGSASNGGGPGGPGGPVTVPRTTVPKITIPNG